MAEAPKRLKLCDDAFGGWWQVSDDTPAEEVIEYVLADIADAQREALSDMLNAETSQAIGDARHFARKALAKGDEG